MWNSKIFKIGCILIDCCKSNNRFGLFLLAFFSVTMKKEEEKYAFSAQCYDLGVTKVDEHQ